MCHDAAGRPSDEYATDMAERSDMCPSQQLRLYRCECCSWSLLLFLLLFLLLLMLVLLRARCCYSCVCRAVDEKQHEETRRDKRQRQGEEATRSGQTREWGKGRGRGVRHTRQQWCTSARVLPSLVSACPLMCPVVLLPLFRRFAVLLRAPPLQGDHQCVGACWC